ncbi:MAG: hypothetical protein M1812_003882 [Candelaria pacifica]|nr:MAG: hypothetical protein M1812_003882 [Candelaria pacifica]
MSCHHNSSGSDSEEELLFPGRKPGSTTLSRTQRSLVASRRPATITRREPPARLTMMCYSSDEESSDSDKTSDGGIVVSETESDTSASGASPRLNGSEEASRVNPSICSSSDGSSGLGGNEGIDTPQPDEYGKVSISNAWDGRYVYFNTAAFLEPQRALQATLVENVAQLQEAMATLTFQKDVLQAAISKPLPDDPMESVSLAFKEQLQLAVTTPLPMEMVCTELEEDRIVGSSATITDLRELAVREILQFLSEDTGSSDVDGWEDDLQTVTKTPLPQNDVELEQLPCEHCRQIVRAKEVAIVEEVKEKELVLQNAIATRLPDEDNVSRADKVKNTLKLFSTGELHEALWAVGQFYYRNKKLFIEEGMTKQTDYRRMEFGESVSNLREGPSREEIAKELGRRGDQAFGGTPADFYCHPNDYLGSKPFEELLRVRAHKAESEDGDQIAASRDAVRADPIKALAWATQDCGGYYKSTEPQIHRMWLAQYGGERMTAPAIEALKRVRKWYGTNHHIGKSITKASPSNNEARNKDAERGETAIGRRSRTIQDRIARLENSNKTNALYKRQSSGDGDRFGGEKKLKQDQIRSESASLQSMKDTESSQLKVPTGQQPGSSTPVQARRDGARRSAGASRTKAYRDSPYAKARDSRKKYQSGGCDFKTLESR